MDKCELVDKLKKLEEVSFNYEKALKDEEKAKDELILAESYISSRLSTFDGHYKNKYVLEKIGEKPKPLGKWNPLNLSKKKREAVVASIEEYSKKKAKAEEEFYQLNEKKRKALEKEDVDDKVNRISVAKEKLNLAEEHLKRVRLAWKQDELLSERLRNTTTIRKVLEFFEDGRVDTMKEAVNLYYDETRKDEEARLASEHREKIESAIKQQIVTLQEVVDKVDSATSNADEALRLAREAIDRADEAYSRAEEAIITHMNS